MEKPQKYYMQLSTLNTFSRDIKVLIRVTDKSELKPYTNEKGDGLLFNFSILDQEGSEMQVTCFNKTATKFFDLIEEGKVYEITGGYVKLNNRKFISSGKDYQLILNEASLIKPIVDEGNITYLKIKTRKLAELKEIPTHTVIDTVGYVLEASERQLVNTKNGEMYMRKVFIADDSEFKVEFALWKKNSEVEMEVGDIILIRNGIVSEFNGKNISGTDNTKITLNPRGLKEASALAKWIKGYNGTFKTYNIVKPKKEEGENVDEIDKTEVKRLDEIISGLFEMKGRSKEEPAGYYTIKATVSFFQHSDKNFYAGCPVKKCKKKLTDEENGYFCTACHQMVKVPAYYMTLNIRIKDCCSEHWADLFGPAAEKFLGITVEDYRELIVNNSIDRLEEISRKVDFLDFFMVIRAKLSTFNNIVKKKINVYKTERVNIHEEFDRLLRQISK